MANLVETSAEGQVRVLPELPVLSGPTYPSINPVDDYQMGKAENSRRMIVSSMNLVAKMFAYPDYLHTPWGAMTYKHVNDLKNRLLKEGRSPSSINTILSHVRGTARSAFLLTQMDSDNYARIKEVKMVKGSRLPQGRMVDLGELNLLVKTCVDDENNAMGMRDLAMIGLMYICGLRRHEVSGLNLEKIDFKASEIRVVGKGNKERKIFPDKGTILAIKDWLTYRGEVAGPLFWQIRKGGNLVAGRISPQTVYDIVQKRQGQAGVSHIAPHDFRKTFISTVLKQTGDLRKAQRLAGHADPATTAMYDIRPDEELREAASGLSLPYFHKT